MWCRGAGSCKRIREGAYRPSSANSEITFLQLFPLRCRAIIPLVSEIKRGVNQTLRGLETVLHRRQVFEPQKNGRMSPYPHHKLHTHTLFLGTTPTSPRVQRHLRELWVYRKPRTQDNSESQVLNSGRPGTSHIPESRTRETLRCLGFLNQETCPVCRPGDPPRGKSPHAPAAKSPLS